MEKKREIKEFNEMIKEYQKKANVELLKEIIEENGLNIIPTIEAQPTLIFRQEIREYLKTNLI